MRLIRLKGDPIKAFSSFDKLQGEFVVVLQSSICGVFASKGADHSIVNTNKLPKNSNIITTTKGIGGKYSLIAYAPNTFTIVGKVIDKTLNRTKLLNKVVDTFTQLGYLVEIDKNSSGNDLLYENKKVVGMIIEVVGEHTYFALAIQGSVSEELVGVLSCIDYPQVKLKDKSIMDRVGGLPNLEDRFDELCQSVKDNFHYDFKDSKDTWQINNELLLWGEPYE